MWVCCHGFLKLHARKTTVNAGEEASYPGSDWANEVSQLCFVKQNQGFSLNKSAPTITILYAPGPMRTHRCFKVLNKRAYRSSHQSSKTKLDHAPSSSVTLESSVTSNSKVSLKSFLELSGLPSTKILFIFFYQILLDGAQSCVTSLWPFCHFLRPQAHVAVSAYNVHHWKNTSTMKSCAPNPVSAAPVRGLYLIYFL